MSAPRLPDGFFLGTGDVDLLILYGPEHHPVAVFSADGATSEEIEREASRQAELRRPDDHPQRVVADALWVEPPISDEMREQYRRRLARSLLRELDEVTKVLAETAFGRDPGGRE